MHDTRQYFEWLTEQAMIDTEGRDGYSMLCRKLFSSRFTATNDMDQNRVEEAMALREEWNGDILPEEIEPYDTCNMLELLIVMARRMTYEMYDSQYEAGTGKWFQELIGNCRLDEFTNGYFDDYGEEYGQEMVDEILDKIIRRRYGWDGEGGLFPLMYPQYDQRRAELITQMNNYLEENYDIC